MDIPEVTPAYLDDCLCELFTKDRDLTTVLGMGPAIEAFMELTGIYITRTHPILLEGVRFDHNRISAVLRRFHRDAFGVVNFIDSLDKMVDAQTLKMPARIGIVQELKNLGIRINSDKPRKTKIAAAMSLWISAIHPVYFDKVYFPGVDPTILEYFSGSLNFWICTAYLSKFGRILLEDSSDCQIRMHRIRHDLTYRAVNLSSLEVLYSGLFQINPGEEN